ncbi:MAG: hypothetical protein JO227_06220 [Acetobacteraceae bacterium]|nr:hypothetical protein [Acetobacteraceae bacterium]
MSLASSPLHPAVLATMLRTTLDAIPISPDVTAAEKATQFEAALKDIEHLAPADPTQARLAARIVSAHYAAQECLRRAARPDLPDSVMMRLQGKAAALDRMGRAAQRQLDKLKAAQPIQQATPASAPAAERPAMSPVPHTARPKSPPPQPVRKDPMHREEATTPATTAPLSAEEEQALLQRAMNDLFDRSSTAVATLMAGLAELPDAA